MSWLHLQWDIGNLCIWLQCMQPYMVWWCVVSLKDRYQRWSQDCGRFQTTWHRYCWEIVCGCGKVMLTEDDDEKQIASVLSLFSWVCFLPSIMTNRAFFDKACKWCCIQNEQYRAQHRALRNNETQGRFCRFLVIYEDIFCQKGKSETSSGLYHKCQSCVWGEREEFHGLLYEKLLKDPKAREYKFCYHWGK